MIRFIDTRDLNANVDLYHLQDDLYILSSHNNPISFLKDGCIIWYKHANEYRVYKLTESFDSASETIDEFLERLLSSISQNL